MPPLALLATYSAVILAGAVLGALVPLRLGPGAKMTGLLAFAAGVMFGASFFHMLPEAFHAGGLSVFSFAPVGFFALFLLERTMVAHTCEEPVDTPGHAPHAVTMGLTA